MDNHINSPIMLLEQEIRDAAMRAAPERESELTAIVNAKGLHFRITADIRDISVNTVTGRITLGVSALEHLWSAALFYYCLYSDYAAAQRASQVTDETKFDIAMHPRSLRAMTLLNWATNQWVAGARTEWPLDIRPVLYPTSQTDEHVANELFLFATAWTIHHEYSHARLGHANRELFNSMSEEKDADMKATEWIFDQAPSEKHLRLRGLGVIVGILALDVLEFARQDPPATSHPKAYERLAYCLRQYSQEENDEAFAFALCGMQFNLSQRKIHPNLDANSFAEILNECFAARALHGRRTSK